MITKPKTQEEKKTRTVVDTIMVTPDSICRWKAPPFQRPLKQNAKVLALAEDLKRDGGVWPGVITLGFFNGETYLIDGQHRCDAFVRSGLKEGFTDIRTHHFSSFSDMGDEFVKLNSSLVRLRPDDILRGMEGSVDSLQQIRRVCPFIGYDMIRRGTNSPLISMSASLRCWKSSSPDIPSTGGSGTSIVIARGMDEHDTANFCEIMILCMKAFGRDLEYARLWGSLNITIVMWLYRRLVLSQYSAKSVRLTRDQFTRCLMSLSSSSDYLDWLLGRQMNERDRSPAYARIKSIFSKRLTTEMGTKILLPQPSWSVGHNRVMR